MTGFIAIAACGDGAAQDAEPIALRVHIENVAPFTHLKSGTFAVPVAASDPGPLGPGAAYEFSFTAGPRHRLSFATMFGQSNDWFFAPLGGSLALYDDEGEPISGDITDQIGLYDAGTEIDEEPAVGPHTAPNQASSADGPGDPDPDDTVRLVPNPVTLTAGDDFARPSVDEMIAVTVTSDAETREFTVRIENVSVDGVTLMTSDGGKNVRVSPGVFSVGAEADLLFSEGAADRRQGLEQIAEGGDVSVLSASLEPLAGVATPISPGLYVIHSSGAPLYSVGEADRGEGLELIAERGDPGELAASFNARPPEDAATVAVFNIPAGAAEPGPLRFGDAYDIDIEALPGERISFASMYGASNDWIFATPEDGILLVSPDGTPQTGDVTGEISIRDVGTELDEEPGVGPNIGAPEGPVDPDSSVRNADYAVAANQHILVTITTR